MILVNEGMIIATGTNSLEIDTGANTIVNSGTLEATGSGGLVIDSNLENSGLLWANGANITFDWQGIDGWCGHDRIRSGVIHERNVRRRS